MPDGSTIDAPLALFPEAREGDVYTISRNDDEQDDRRKRIADKFERLKNR